MLSTTWGWVTAVGITGRQAACGLKEMVNRVLELFLRGWSGLTRLSVLRIVGVTSGDAMEGASPIVHPACHSSLNFCRRSSLGF